MLINQTVLEVKGLVKYFPIHRSKDVVKAVNDVSFDIKQGETLALIGESGSGKTTVGRCILKLIDVTSGEIKFLGENITPLNQREFRKFRSKIQMVFQEPYGSINPRMKVGDFVEEPLLLEKLIMLQSN